METCFTNDSARVVLLLICGALLTLPASAQHFQQVTGTLVSVAAGRNEVFGIDPHGLPWRYDAAKESFEKVTGAASLVQIAVGGGTLSQLDEVWAVGTGGKVYRFNYRTDAFDPISAPSFSHISVGEGAAQNLFSSSLNPDKCYPYEVWGVGPSDGNAQFARYNFCENTFNSGFVFNGPFTQGATGGGDIWVLNKQDAPFHFIDSESELSIANVPLTQIAVGVNDVWGLNRSNEIFRYDPNTAQFVQIGGILRQIVAGGGWRVGH